MMMGQVGLVVAPLYLQTGQLRLRGDTEEGAPFLKPYKKLIDDMCEELALGEAVKMDPIERDTYRLRLAKIKNKYQKPGSIHGYFSRT